MRYQRIVSLAIASALVCTPLVACGAKGASPVDGSAAEQGAAAEDAKFQSPWSTLREVFEAGGEVASTIDDDAYVCVVGENGHWIRVEAELTPEVAEAASNAWTGDVNKLHEILADVEVTSASELNAMDESKLSEFVGKTGADLEDAGFILGEASESDSGVQCVATLDDIEYAVIFKGEGTDARALEITSIQPVGPAWTAL